MKKLLCIATFVCYTWTAFAQYDHSSNSQEKTSVTKDLKEQREFFTTLSSNMASVATALKSRDKPLYIQYCPMKKAAWISSEKQIRNPYYGSSMLTCDEVRETL